MRDRLIAEAARRPDWVVGFQDETWWTRLAWHVSRRVADWIAAHNRRVRRHGGCRIRVCGLPVKAPWLNAIEPKWVHGKRAVVEPDRKVSAEELRQRVCDYYGCPPEPPLPRPEA